MSDDRDPILHELFAQAEHTYSDDSFTLRVMEQAAQRDRRRAITWIAVDVVLIVLAWTLAEPLQEIVFLLLPGLTTSLIDLGNGLLAQLLLPINNVAALLALVGLGVRSIYRRLL